MGWTSFYASFIYCEDLRVFLSGDCNTLGVTDTSEMFYDNYSLYTIDMSTFDMDNAIDAYYMFDNATPGGPAQAGSSINLSGWDLRGGADCESLLYEANVDDLDISNWKVPNSFNDYDIFDATYVENGVNANDWDLSLVDSLYNALYSIYTPYVTIENWDTQNITSLEGTFAMIGYQSNDDRFTLENLSIASLTTASNMLGYPMTTTSYDATLIAWANQPHQNNVTVDFSTSQYTLGGEIGSAEAARNILIADGWTINDGGGV